MQAEYILLALLMCIAYFPLPLAAAAASQPPLNPPPDMVVITPPQTETSEYTLWPLLQLAVNRPRGACIQVI